MKKLFFSFILIFCLSAGFAETGYRGHEWYSKKNTFSKNGLDSAQTGSCAENLIYSKSILETKTYLIYSFAYDNNELLSAGYVIPKNKEKLLKQALKSKNKKSYKIELGDYGNLEAEIKEFTEKNEKEICSYIYDSLSCLIFQINNFGNGISEIIEPNGNYTLTIYDYNDDTRCYIFENAVPDKTVVIYIPHEQDY
jgi:hypothetical protein